MDNRSAAPQEPLDPTPVLARLLAAHGLPCQEAKGWLLPHGQLPAMGAHWTPGENNGRLDVHVLLDNDVRMMESFAGLGAGQQGLDDALENFSANVLHVLLAGLWGIADEAQVTERRWEIAGRDYMAYIGNFGLRGAAEHLEQPLFEALFRQATAALRAEKLDQDTHWSRLFFCNLNGEFVTEALLDNQRWEAGLSMLGALPWPAAQGYYSLRHFMLLRAV
ncbi:DUF6348 family protein [Chromobacterium aquaticum]|uniref:DUF6348 family protein n=2 Tax=Chromobacterium aquaticum TaxID=467180 RepID=A0ABV8ZV92_9NEIS